MRGECGGAAFLFWHPHAIVCAGGVSTRAQPRIVEVAHHQNDAAGMAMHGATHFLGLWRSLRSADQARIRSIEPEINLHIDLHCHWHTVFARWLESPATNRLDCLLVKSHAECPLNANLLRVSVRPHDEP